MNRAIIVHCWEGYPEYCWYPYVKKELEEKGFSVKVPTFPETEAPKQDAWVSCLTAQVGHPDTNLFLIGHSAGCITILRYLETLSENERVGGVVLVAGFTDNIGYEELSNFFTTPIDFGRIKGKSKNGFVAIHSDNDPYVDLKFAHIFKKELGAKMVIKHAMGHFSGPIEKEGSCTELPDVVHGIEELSSQAKTKTGRK
ncbi:MAG: alpha/beta hydrolase [bacterium]|nr:alpha/beta hydrolase [bacterium]